MQVSAYYKHIETPDKDICDAFVDELNASPQKLMDQIKKMGNSTVASSVNDMLAGKSPPGFEAPIKEEIAMPINDEL